MAPLVDNAIKTIIAGAGQVVPKRTHESDTTESARNEYLTADVITYLLAAAGNLLQDLDPDFLEDIDQDVAKAAFPLVSSTIMDHHIAESVHVSHIRGELRALTKRFDNMEKFMKTSVTAIQKSIPVPAAFVGPLPVNVERIPALAPASPAPRATNKAPIHTPANPAATYAAAAKKPKTRKLPAPGPTPAKAAPSPPLPPAKPSQVVLILKEKRGRIPVDLKSLDALNTKLAQAGCKEKILAITQSSNGNPIIHTSERGNPELILPHADLIIASILPDPTSTPTVEARINQKYFEFRIDNALRVDPYSGALISTTRIWEAAQATNAFLASTTLAAPPRWLGDKREGVAHGSILTAVTSEDVYNKIIATTQAYAFGSKLLFSSFKAKKRPRYCGSCGSLQHSTWLCKQPRCFKCTSTEHDTNNHPDDLPEKCVNCKGQHHATHHECPSRHGKTLKDRLRKGVKNPPPTAAPAALTADGSQPAPPLHTAQRSATTNSNRSDDHVHQPTLPQGQRPG